MSEIRDRIANLDIRVRSADGSVSGRLSMRAGIGVEFARDARDRHDEESLSRCVEEVLRGLAVGKRRAGEMIREKARQGHPEAAPDSAIGRRRIEVEEKLADIDVTAESPDGYITIRMLGADRFIVVMRRGTLGRLADGRLAREIGAAMSRVSREFAKYAKEITALAYDSAKRSQRTKI